MNAPASTVAVPGTLAGKRLGQIFSTRQMGERGARPKERLSVALWSPVDREKGKGELEIAGSLPSRGKA